MPTDVDVANMALARIGHTRFLQSLDDTGVEASVLRGHLDTARQSVLEDFPWRFATRTVALAALAGTTRNGWAYVYALPSGCLAVQALEVEDMRADSLTPESRAPYDLGLNDAADAMVLMTDAEDAVLRYTADVPLGLFSAQAADALAWRLAAEAALGLKKDARTAQSMLAMYQGALAYAGASQLRQGQDGPPPLPRSIAARGRGFSR